MFAVSLIMHWLHIVAAISAIGGSLFLRLVVHPALQNLEPGQRSLFSATAMPKIRKFIMHSVMTLLVTGLFNVHRVAKEGVNFHGPYGMIFLAKFGLAMAVFGIALGLVVPSEAFEKFQARRPFWLLVNVLLGFIVVLLSAWLRLLPRV